MLKKLIKSPVVHKCLVALLLFLIAAFLLPSDTMIELLNGLFIGMSVTVGIIFRHILAQAIRGEAGYGRVEQFALGIGFLWVGVIIMRLNSVWVRSITPPSFLDFLNYYWTSLGVATVVSAGFLQVTAPGLHDEFIHAQDRRTLLWASGVGIFLAFAIFLLQKYKLLLTLTEYIQWLTT